MAPKVTSPAMATHTAGTCRLAHNSVEITIAAQISKPPMVGVPAFFWCDCGSVFANVLADLELAQDAR